MWTRLRVLLLGAVAVGFALFCLEVGLRVLNMYRPPTTPLKPVRPDLFRPDERIGYHLWPSTATMWRDPPDSPRVLSLISNSDGFRSSRELDEPDSRYRILVVGDSFVFGLGVEVEERFSDVLERLEPSWRVDNLGMVGFGLDLMVRSIEHVGLKARPDMVVLAVYTDCFRRLLPYYSGMGYALPKFHLGDSGLVSTAYPHPSRWERMRIAQGFYQNYWSGRRNRYDLNEALLERFLELGREHDFGPVVVFIPGRDDTPEDRERREFLRDWAARTATPHLDLTDPIHGAGVDRIYIENDYHWNERGHRSAALELRPFLAGARTTP